MTRLILQHKDIKSTTRTIALTLIAAVVATTLTLASASCGSDNTPATQQPVATPETVSEQATPTSETLPTSTSAVPTKAPSKAASNLEVKEIEAWINSEPTTISQLTSEGKVVLVDFWTYTCVNCLRTLPFLREWQEKYADHGLVILGVHAPEFDFEKEIENVQMAVEDEMVSWPVALDNEMRTWRSFNNRYWPAKYLIGTNHNLLYSHFGEGKYRETEEKIREALQAAGYDVSGIPIGEVENVRRDTSANEVTRELYGGYDRNYSVFGAYAANDEYYDGPDREFEYVDRYTDPTLYPKQQFVLQGLWRNEREAIVHARQTEDLSDYIALKFIGRSANVVVDPPEPEEFKVFVELDDRPLSKEEAGVDIEYDSEGNSFFLVNEGRMYKIVEVPEFDTYTLKLSSNSSNFAIFAFTFGVYDGGF